MPDTAQRCSRGTKSSLTMLAVLALLAGCAADAGLGTDTGPSSGPSEAATGITADVATLQDVADLGLTDDERFELLLGLARDEPALTVYSSDNREVPEALVESFRRRFPGVAVEYVALDVDDLSVRLTVERAAGRRTADVVFTSAPVLGELLQRGELLPHHGVIVPNDQFLDLVHPSVNLTRVETQVIAWSTDWRAAEDGPQTLDDLLRPEFSGCVHTGSPTWVALLIQQRGEPALRDWFARFLDNGGVMAESTGRQLRRLGAGEIDCLVLGRETALQGLAEDGARLAWALPEPATTLSHGIAIVEGTRSPFAAALFALWVAQPEQVMVHLENSGGLGLHPGLANDSSPGGSLVELERLRRGGYLVLDLDAAGDLAPLAFELLAEYYTPNLLGP
jgi:ABC-type Fe3+ transport system substrate-binding protein